MVQDYKSKFFLRFLKDNDALCYYLNSFNKYHKKPSKDYTIFEFIKTTKELFLIPFAFSWDATKNYNYWYELNRKWYKFFKENESKR